MFDRFISTSSSLLSGKRVSIIGAGPSGLTLARILQMRGAAVEVFERDASRAVRGQGGSLDMHEDSGQLALQGAGLTDSFLAISRPEGQNSRVYDRYGVLRAELTADKEAQSRPEIDRGALRDLLLDSLIPGTVVWNRPLQRVERDASGKISLVFNEAPAIKTDLVLGCDGGWSKVRPLRSDLVPRYSGVTFVQTWISNVDERHPDLARLVGSGNIMALGDNKGLMAQRNGDGHIRIYVALRVEEEWPAYCGFDFADPSAARTGLLSMFKGWSDELLTLLRKADGIFQPWPLFSFPPEQSWRPQPDVTLLGDAAHIMPPFTGKGANYGMLDAIELANRLTSDRFADVAAALADYESAMLARMAAAIKETLASQDLMIAPNAPDDLVSVMLQRTS